MGTAGQSAQASTGRSQEPGQGSACYGMLAVVPQVKEDKVRYCRSGQTGGMCMGQDIGGVTPRIKGCKMC